MSRHKTSACARLSVPDAASVKPRTRALLRLLRSRAILPAVRLIIVHHHFRPGGVRRVIEVATPHLLSGAGPRLLEVVLAGGEAPDALWWDRFTAALAPVPVTQFIEPAFGYLAEQRNRIADVRARCRRALAQLLADAAPATTLVWAHNLSLGRNLLVARELSRLCAARGLPLLAHQHDWWFDHRWSRWPEMRRAGFRTLGAVARALFGGATVQHLVINAADAAMLRPALGRRVAWLPNPVDPPVPVPARACAAARRWLQQQVPRGAPVWLVPARLLRRKNLAEALLLTRWLRPGAWLVTTGGASSAEEQPYAERLAAAAGAHGWPLRLGVLAGDESAKPGLPALMSASEALLLTSLGEGFGLPYLEAAAARRPLLARALPNIAPDLARFGFRFPQTYLEVFLPPELFAWRAERARQARLFRAWRRTVPASYRRWVRAPDLLEAGQPVPVPFSRLTLSAQLEVLAHPPAASLAAAEPLNPWLRVWRERAAAGRLEVSAWPAEAERWLGGRAYARRFFRAWRAARRRHDETPPAAARCQAAAVRARLELDRPYPLLWSPAA